MNTYPIAITSEDIGKGAVSDCYSCPIALAAHRRWRGFIINVGHFNIAVWRSGSPTRKRLYSLPPEARQFIDDFDSHRSVEPITFTVTEIL